MGTRTSSNPLSCVLVVVARISVPDAFVGAGAAVVPGDATGVLSLELPPQAGAKAAAKSVSETRTRVNRDMWWPP